MAVIKENINTIVICLCEILVGGGIAPDQSDWIYQRNHNYARDSAID